MSRILKQGEAGKSLWQRMVDVALTDVGVLVKGLDEGSLEQLEELLIEADFGVPATLRLVEEVQRLAERGQIRSAQEFRAEVRRQIVAVLSSGRADTALRFDFDGPTVFLVVGVNGVGKTTSIGKLAHRFHRQGRRVLLVAGDTFRAGATEQLRRWSERVGCDFLGGEPGRDPAAVAFDAMERAAREGHEVVIVDTAGRLHTQSNLMQEIEKVQRVLARKREGAPHETLLVLDATTGQNALAQARSFGKSLPLSGIVLAKFDSTARGGIIVALKEEFDLPVKLVGTGEGIDDLEPFSPERFADAVLS
jgi:fused signal recognition particle receptor